MSGFRSAQASRAAAAALALTVATTLAGASGVAVAVTAHRTGSAAWPPGWREPVRVPAGHVVPLWQPPGGAHADRYPGQWATPDSIGEPGGYDPGELRSYLGLRGTGAGQTVAVTEAFYVSPSVTAAMAGYDRWYGLTPACSAAARTGCFRLSFAAPRGTISPISKIGDWIPEADLDVEVIHALVPRAAIVVVEARDDTISSVMAAIDYARRLHPAAVGNSWGEDEFTAERSFDGHCAASGAICVFSSGNCGSYAHGDQCPDPGSGYPAADPAVLAVGGTTLDLAPSGRVRSETGWSGSGGGISHYEPRPAYQQAADHWPAGRGIPDVSFDANPDSGIAAYVAAIFRHKGKLRNLGSFWAELGGTSVGAAAWAAILASADQLRRAAGRPPLAIGQAHTAVYAGAASRPVADVTLGANGTCVPACSARPGYDLVTGEGSPRPGIDTYLASRPPSAGHGPKVTRS